MFVIKIKGGLGNQLFQYATGRFLSIKTNSDVCLDANFIPSHKKETLRNFDLNKFNIIAETKSEDEIQKIKNPLGKFSEIFRIFKIKFLFQYNLDFHPRLLKKSIKKLNKKNDLYLEGYFQSEKNFLEIRDVLLKELTLKEEFQSQNFKEIQNEISKRNSVSVHIRRGDYIKNPSVTKHHGICDISYYQNAISEIKNKTTNPIFYFFSDDPQWVSENFTLNENSKIISGSNLSAPEELMLMSSCKHNIIANSTFSWWGAWLNQNHDKIVIAPTPWVDAPINPHKNIIPETWIQIPKNH